MGWVLGCGGFGCGFYGLLDFGMLAGLGEVVLCLIWCVD